MWMSGTTEGKVVQQLVYLAPLGMYNVVVVLFMMDRVWRNTYTWMYPPKETA